MTKSCRGSLQVKGERITKIMLEVIAMVLSGFAFCIAFFTLWYVLHKAEVKGGTEMCARLYSLVADMIMLVVGCFLVSAVVFGCVHMFRLWDTGRLLVGAVSMCSDFLSAAVWPLMILLLVIIYRKHVVEALEKVPKFIENYHTDGKVSAADMTDDNADSGGGNEALTAENNNSKRPKSNQGRIGQPNEAAAFMDYVLTKLQRELKEPIRREVNLFSNRFVCFDGAVVRGPRITGIEVCYSQYSCEKKLLQYEKFYRSLSENDQRHFDLMFCVRGDGTTLCRLENLRSRISFPVEFRCFQYQSQTDSQKESKK